MARRTWRGVAFLAALAAAAAGCSGDDGKDGRNGRDGDPGPAGPPGTPAPVEPTDPNLAEDEDLPGVLVAIQGLAGATGAGGAFQVGDTIAVTFRVTKGDGSYLGLDELDSGSIYVSGPTTHYQRVLPRATDLIAASAANADGSYTYTFASPIPAVYAAPYNDTASFGPGDGELAGQDLENGTYTLGIEVYKNYYVGSESFRDPANVTRDFLFGSAAVLQPREVVTRANCNQCHESLRAHGGGYRRDPRLCVLCHTAGAEDNNSAALGGGTPGVSIDLGVMIHRIHNAKHLPSVLGVGTNPDGSRDYAAAPRPLVYAGGSSLHDFSAVAFPVWPNFSVAMPRDAGYSALPSASRSKEDEMRRGATACEKCHGDPDGAGPLPAPAQGGNAYSQQTRRACGSCHDDIDWTVPYTANGVTMPAQGGDSSCTICHPASGSSLSPADAHVHPLKDPAFNPGLKFNVSSVTEAGTHNGDGNVDPGEKVQVAFTLTDDAGGPVSIGSLNAMSVLVNGPTTNNLVLLYNTSVPVGYFGAGPNYTAMLPERVFYEWAGTSSSASLQTFTTARSPHWITTTGINTVTTAVWTRTGTTGVSVLSAAVAPYQNYLDVASAAPFAAGADICLDDGTGNREYLNVQSVSGNRLWLGSINSTARQPWIRKSHGVGAVVSRVTLTAKTATTQFTVNASAGSVTEVAEFGDVDVVVSYTTDFVMPAYFPAPIMDSPDLDETWGEWTGKPVVDGTYTISIWGYLNRVFSVGGEATTFRGTSPAGAATFLVGAATTPVPYSAISSGSNCYRCHDDVYFHGGGRRGFEACLACHGNSGSELTAPGSTAPPDPVFDPTVAFRTMLHKVHAEAFPAMPGGARQCSVCHGDGNSNWKEPPGRDYPGTGGQSRATRSWRATCGACHTSSAAAAHIDLNTATATTGAEACAVCHGAGKEWPVESKHRTR